MIVTQQASNKFSVKDTLLANPDEFHNSTGVYYMNAWNDQCMAMTCHDFAKIVKILEQILLYYVKYQWMNFALILLRMVPNS